MGIIMIEEAPLRDLPKGVTIPVSWASWLGKVRSYAGAVSDSGTTAQRPTAGLFVARPYFDTTLGKPIWLKTVSPSVWVDATGASV